MKKLINICGAVRSGTTMQNLMLENEEKAFPLGEVYVWYRPWRKHHFETHYSCEKRPCPSWKKIFTLMQHVSGPNNITSFTRVLELITRLSPGIFSLRIKSASPKPFQSSSN